MKRRVRYFGPWVWYAPYVFRTGGRWVFGWRVVITEAGQRLDQRGTLLDVVWAAVDFPPDTVR